MHIEQQRFTDAIAAVLVTMTAWIVLYQLHDWWFQALDWADGVSWIFLPAAVRLLAVLLFGFAGALGLFFGGLFTMSMIEEASLSKSIGVAAASALGPWLAVHLLVRRLRLPQTLSGLGPAQLAVLAIGSAAASVCLHNLVYWLIAQRSDPVSGILPMFAGDIVGTLIILYLARTAIRLYLRLRLGKLR